MGLQSTRAVSAKKKIEGSYTRIQKVCCLKRYTTITYNDWDDPEDAELDEKYEPVEKPAAGDTITVVGKLHKMLETFTVPGFTPQSEGEQDTRLAQAYRVLKEHPKYLKDHSEVEDA